MFIYREYRLEVCRKFTAVSYLDACRCRFFESRLYVRSRCYPDIICNERLEAFRIYCDCILARLQLSVIIEVVESVDCRLVVGNDSAAVERYLNLVVVRARCRLFSVPVDPWYCADCCVSIGYSDSVNLVEIVAPCIVHTVIVESDQKLVRSVCLVRLLAFEGGMRTGQEFYVLRFIACDVDARQNVCVDFAYASVTARLLELLSRRFLLYHARDMADMGVRADLRRARYRVVISFALLRGRDSHTAVKVLPCLERSARSVISKRSCRAHARQQAHRHRCRSGLFHYRFLLHKCFYSSH